MKKMPLFLAVIGMCLSVSALAVKKETFTCEQIKDKAVRGSCIDNRNGERAKDAEIKAFVIRAKEELTSKFKDPGSAQFTHLIVVSNDDAKSKVLCGMVNAKNSYGGYIGAKFFYVKWRQIYEDDNLGMTVWINDGTEDLQLAKTSLVVAKFSCEDGGYITKSTVISVN